MATKTYLYQVDKKITKQGAILTDEGGNTVYEADLDMAFLVTFAIARTDQVFYS